MIVSGVRNVIYLLSLTLVLNVQCSWAGSLTVSNVRAAQRVQTKLVDIFYDLSATSNGLYSITVSVSTNNGATYDLTASHFSGNGIGNAVTIGVRKQIIWDAGLDWPGQYSSAVKFRVTAVETRS